MAIGCSDNQEVFQLVKEFLKFCVALNLCNNFVQGTRHYANYPHKVYGYYMYCHLEHSQIYFGFCP